MRIYEGSPRQDFEEVFRSIGAFIDQRGMREVLLVEAPDGFIVQGIVSAGAAGGAWSESIGSQAKETLTFLDDDIARFMEESIARRGHPGPEPKRDAGFYETALRVIGRYVDEQRPRDVFFFEQGGAFVVRLFHGGPSGGHHSLTEFTRDDVAELVTQGPTLRQPTMPPGAAKAPAAGTSEPAAEDAAKT